MAGWVQDMCQGPLQIPIQVVKRQLRRAGLEEREEQRRPEPMDLKLAAGSVRQ